jgi:hypothetical protein
VDNVIVENYNASKIFSGALYDGCVDVWLKFKQTNKTRRIGK